MEKHNKLAIKTKRFLEKIGCPRFLHHFGPKKYEISEHIIALQLKEICRMSLRRLEKFLSLMGIRCPSYSALCKSRKRIPRWIWDKMLKITSSLSSENVAIDGTGFSQTNPSFHYLHRINSKKPVKRFAKLSALFDIDKRKFLALKIRVRPRHDSKDFLSLFKKYNNFRKFYGDTAYDAEFIHEKCFENEIQTFIKPRKNVRRGFYRGKQMKNYSEEEYHRRSLVESGFGSVKRKYGGMVLARKQHGIKSEIYLKAINHNLNLIRQ